MGQMISLTAADGHVLNAYRADPQTDSQTNTKGAVVVIQEIFGVNSHIRSVADSYAQAGYVAIAPALFDRVDAGIELGYETADVERGRELAFPMGWDKPLLDINAAVAAAATTGSKTGIVGYCWGGSLSYLAACKSAVDCAVVYYGGQILKILAAQPELQPQVPVTMHFGEHDHGIPLEDVERIRQRHPDVPVHLYDAGHGFNCDQRGSYSKPASELARQRTLDFFQTNLG